tara:strand:+ start:381 stop:518 length:138 start_codon:yes stop_codon:yes gene_type:complete
LYRSPNYLEEEEEASDVGEGFFQYGRGVGIPEAAPDILRAPRKVP